MSFRLLQISCAVFTIINNNYYLMPKLLLIDNFKMCCCFTLEKGDYSLAISLSSSEPCRKQPVQQKIYWSWNLISCPFLNKL